MKIKQLQTWGELSKQGGQVGALGGGGVAGGGELFPPHLYCGRSDLSRLDAQLHCGQAASGVGDGKWGSEG